MAMGRWGGVALLSALGWAVASTVPAAAQDPKPPLRIGVLSDMSGHLADMSGTGTVAAVKMAVTDFGGTVLGRPIEVVSADHLNKSDTGLAIARKWYDVDGVRIILDVNNSALALAVQSLTRDKDRIVVFGGAFSSDLTGKVCSPNGLAWVTDTYTQTRALVTQFASAGLRTWFTLTPDYAFGIAAQRDVEAAVAATGGKFLGAARVPSPISETSSFVLQAQASGAQVVELLQGGDDLQGVIKTAHEFGLGLNGKTKLSTFALWLGDVRGLGLEAAQGIRATNAFYWDQDDATRAWAQRYFKLTNRMPETMPAAMYSATMHYLAAVKAAGTDETAAVLAEMRNRPVEDFMTHGATIRPDGRLLRDMYILEVKTPAESKGSWDVFKPVSRIAAADAVRPLAEGGCPLVR